MSSYALLRKICYVIMVRMRATVLTISLSAILVVVGVARSQEIPRDKYLKYVPLTYPRLVRQSVANDALHLYGDRTDPAYRDVNPADGIDDLRCDVLESLAVRFAPYLVQNTTNMPTNFDIFIDNSSSFLLNVDTWDISGEEAKLIRSDGINFSALGQAECKTSPIGRGLDKFEPSTTDGATEDCKLVEILDQLAPFAPQLTSLTEPLIRQRPHLFRVLFFDFPGEGPGTWKHAYQAEYDKTPEDRRNTFPHSYVHPFLARVDDEDGSFLGYDLVLQYWFFYPGNDGGNNHEGDWEHMNVVVAPRSMVEQPLSADTINRILTGELTATEEAPDPLVIRRAEYYFHHFVMTLDFSSPNVYQPRDEWKKEVEQRPQLRFQQREIWKAIRHLAYVDDEETRLNTHPFAYIGADNKGIDQALAAPGGRNRNGHGTYPFPGRYIGIGPAGATEQVSVHVDPRRYWKRLEAGDVTVDPVFERGRVVSLADPDRLRIVPDWERVADLTRDDARARRDWSWLLLPIRWGYPATESPFAGILPHADTGNLSPVGPSYSGGWNATGSAPGFGTYEPHTMPSVFPLGFQDSFRNDLGFLNFTLPVLFNLPPLDFLTRIASYPFKAAFYHRDPVYYPNEGIPYRFVGLSSGVSLQIFDDDYNALALNPAQYDEFLVQFVAHFLLNGGDSTTTVVGGGNFKDNSVGTFLQVTFYIGGHFASENTVRNMRPIFGVNAEFNNIPSYTYRAEINYWEYAGSLRYSFTSSRIQPFVKGGYGWSWYRLENVQANGVKFVRAESEWIKPRSVWPNVWHLGLGLEYSPWKRVGRFLGGMELAFRLEYGLYTESLGLDLSAIPLDRLGLLFPTLGDVPGSDRVYRNDFVFGMTLTF